MFPHRHPLISSLVRFLDRRGIVRPQSTFGRGDSKKQAKAAAIRGKRQSSFDFNVYDNPSMQDAPQHRHRSPETCFRCWQAANRHAPAQLRPAPTLSCDEPQRSGGRGSPLHLGEVDLRSKSGEGLRSIDFAAPPHPALRADLSPSGRGAQTAAAWIRSKAIVLD